MYLDTSSLPSGYKIHFTSSLYGYDAPGGKQYFFLISSDDVLVFLEKAPALFADKADEPGFDLYQIEMPISAAAWLVDCIENRLWKSSTEGGLPAGVTHVKEDVGGERLKIRRTMTIGAPGNKGFLVMNLDRIAHYPNSRRCQEFYITDVMLRDGGLLDALKKL